MGMSFGLGKGKDRNSREAAKQAVEACQFQLGGANPDLLMLFVNPFYSSQDVLQVVRESYPNVPLIGCSTAGEIYTTGIDDKTIALLGMAGIQADVAACQNLGDGAFEAGKVLGTKLGGRSGSVVFLLSDGLVGDGEAAVRGVKKGLGGTIPIIGGAAGDNTQFKQTYQFFNDEVFSGSLLGAKLTGSFQFGIGVHHGWEPVGLPVTATKTRGNLLMEINGVPAIRLYEEYFGEYTKRLRDEPLARLAVYYPLGIAIPETDEYLLRAPLYVEADGSLKLTAEIPEKTEMKLMIGSGEEALAAARLAAEDAMARMKGVKPKIVFVINGVARRRLLGLKANEEIQTIREVVGSNVPVLGFYSYGEIAPLGVMDKSEPRFQNETVVILTIG